MKKELKEMSKEDFINKVISAADMELLYTSNEDNELNKDVLSTNVDFLVSDEDVQKQLENEDNKTKVLEDFAQFTKLIKKLKKAKAELHELEVINKDNAELQKYIKLLSKIADLDADIDNARKGYLYESAIKAPELELENADVKISLTMPHTREDFDKDKFISDFDEDTYKKYTTTKDVKGNIKFKIK